MTVVTVLQNVDKCRGIQSYNNWAKSQRKCSEGKGLAVMQSKSSNSLTNT